MCQDEGMQSLREAEREAGLESIATEIVAEVQAWSKAHPEAKWEELEEAVLKARQRFGERVLERLVAEREATRPVVGPRCSQCGAELQYKGQKTRYVVSSLGETTITRRYYHCANCKEGVFPLDESWGLMARRPWSPRLQRLTSKSVARLPYAEAVEVLAEVGGIRVSPSSSWRIGQTWGQRLQAELASEEAEQRAAAGAWSTPGKRPAQPVRLGVALDGAMMYLWNEGWKEFKLGSMYEVAQETRLDPRTGDVGEFGHAVRPSYVAHLGGPEVFGWQLWTEAQRRGWQQATDTQVLGDGAAWIWNLHQEHFHSSLATVDWYHATEHLGKAKLLLHPEGGAAATQWYNLYEKALYLGHAGEIARDLHQVATLSSDPERAAALEKAATYFSNHRDRMQYQELREQGWPIGSGVVESAAKQFKARVTGPGMRWSRAGAEHMLTLRAAVLSGSERFDALWSRAYENLPPS